MRKIQLNGHRYKHSPIKGYAIVDDDKFNYLNQFKWHLSSGGYAVRSYLKDGKSRRIRMARELMAARPDQIVDHKNRNKIDNRLTNLRFVTKSQNAMNSNIAANNKSGYKGVHFDSYSKKWRAEIRLNGVLKRLGRFSKIEDAAKAYSKAAESLFGEYAHINNTRVVNT